MRGLRVYGLCFRAEDGIRDSPVTGVQTCALPISSPYVPAGQNAHAAADVLPASGLKRPGTHAAQSASALAPIAPPYVPAGHALHAATEAPPSSSLNVPPGHGILVPASGQ